MKAEEWRPVVGYEGLYEVSDQGNVRSLDRWTVSSVGRRRFFKGKLLKPVPGNRGYLGVGLTKSGRCSRKSVHRLVALAFLGEPAPGQIVLHGPGGQRDNRAANLSYGTHTHNARDRIRDGTHQCGEKHYLTKLTPKLVQEIRDLYQGGVPQKQIAIEMGMHPTSISSICRGKSWASDNPGGIPSECLYRGERRPNSRLTEAQVKEMRELRASGTTLAELSEKYGVGESCVCNICNRKNWKHVI